MAESKAKSFTRTDVVLTATDGKDKEYKLTPTSIGTVNLTGMKVSGEDYYVKKAVALGATNDQKTQPSAADIVKLVKSAESIEAISEFADDDRKTVKEAYEEKFAELTAE